MPTAEHHAREVEPCDVGGQVRHESDGQHEADDADRHVDEEDPLPAEPVDEHAAEDRRRPAWRRRRPRPRGLIARPRDSAGNVRVITAMVCGIITDAPRPCTTRAAMSPPIVPVKPHHNEASVNIVRPTK